MYANILQGPQPGILADRFKKPRFPISAAELNRLSSLSMSRIYGCRNAGSPLTEKVVGGAGADAIAFGTVQYRRQLTNTQEQGALTDASVGGGWSAGTALNIGVNSFLIGAYFDYDGVESVVFPTVGIWTAGTSPPWAYIGARAAGYTIYFYDGANSKVISVTGIDCNDKKSRGILVHYDAGSGNIYICGTGKTGVQISAMGVWTGLGAVLTPVIGGINGFNATGVGTAYGFIAFGAQLDNWNANLYPLLYKLGWQ